MPILFTYVVTISLHETFQTCWPVGPVDCLNLLAPNDFYRPPKVYHKKFDKNETPVGLLDYQFSLARPQIHWPRSSDQWVFVKTGLSTHLCC
jgi:hypothetical protein